ncbi:hypothetical protein ABW16_07765 [Mycolicibacter heraklionensis]|uniref:PE-PGRS family protein n=1 Tax=Mycolicibacter heraklionensis TaxID=512402 RepID=A0ABR5FHR1_9MYCO|nr:hypothetical protein [Mycolicibacter heraklionensis]KLO30137.1 hypothetical protein ABW16_07765 [Mycolicibacter heraklionensis]
MMHYRLIAAGLATGGGLLTAAFLQAAVAVAGPGDDAVAPSATGADAFTLGGYTFDPYTGTGSSAQEGFDLVHTLTGSAPLLTLGGGSPGGLLPIAPQNFEVYGADGASLGSVNSSVVVTNLAGLTNTQFTITDVNTASGGSAADLPTSGSVYDVFNFGGGFANVYIATPGEDGTVTDTFVTPWGSMDLSSMFAGFNAADPLQPGDAFAALQAGASGGGDDAFAIGGLTLDPFLVDSNGANVGEGFTPVAALGGAAPLLAIGGASLGDPSHQGNGLAPQNFDVYSGTGDDATHLGTINTAVDVTNLFGMTNTQLVVTDGSDTGDGLPAAGTIYDAFNFGGGFANVYVATPGENGTITDTFVTPFGSMDLSSLFSGMATGVSMDPGAAFAALSDSAVGAEAFSIGGTTFDPFTGSGADTSPGFAPVYQTVGALPLLNIGGGYPGLNLGGTWFPLPVTGQDFNIYDGTDLLGTAHAQETVTQLLGLTTTEFVIDGVTPGDGEAADLPVLGSVYSVLNIGGGFANVYSAIPGLDGADSTVTDTFVTPFGDFDLSGLFGGFDASALMDPGAAFLGLDF